ncbi:hypothetical protein E2I00_000495 [Balaenoptera physalus]|uniref:Annexin n=1 Tax=Balaenoptera physalus TaxID=9770 RepID=A0A643CG92_BALPH|nr:hypothetical protein E2I00_000495 [Balaenoptera physalus]
MGCGHSRLSCCKPPKKGPSAWRADPNAGNGTECFCQLRALSGEQSLQTPWEADTGQEKIPKPVVPGAPPTLSFDTGKAALRCQGPDQPPKPELQELGPLNGDTATAAHLCASEEAEQHQKSVTRILQQHEEDKKKWAQKVEKKRELELGEKLNEQRRVLEAEHAEALRVLQASHEQDKEALTHSFQEAKAALQETTDRLTAQLEAFQAKMKRVEESILSQDYKKHIQDLIADLKYELTGKFERLVVGLMRPPAYSDAKEIKDAISGIGTDEKCLIEILASRTNEQIHQLVAAYKDAYERDLEADIIGDTSGHFQKMLVVLLQGTREEDDVVSEDLVQQDVQDLYEAGELKWGTDEAQFIYILGNRSKQHLRLVFDEYLKTTGKPIEASIRGELSGDFEKLMLATVKCIRSTPEYFAERLFKAMKVRGGVDVNEHSSLLSTPRPPNPLVLQGLGTRDNTLIRIMVSRSELDMLDIREIFRTKYEKSLYSMIKNDTSGEYKKTLLKLCGGDDDAAGKFFPEAAQVAYQMWELSAVARVEVKGTVHPAGDFNPDADAKALRKAMKGLGTDEGTITDIITHRSNAQRQQIRQTFKSHFGRDLMADLKSELSGDLARLILGLMMPPAHYDAKQLKKAMEGAGTDEKALIEILATRTNAEIRAINEAYKEDYHKSLEDALSSDTSGHFRRILISLATGNREEGGEDRDRAREDAQVAAEILEIADTTSGDRSSLETRFMTILCTRSYQHLRRVQSVKNKPLFFADKLYKSMKGAGTEEKTLTRIMVSRSEIDLLNIRQEFIEKYDKSLHQAIEVRGGVRGQWGSGECQVLEHRLEILFIPRMLPPRTAKTLLNESRPASLFIPK